MRRASVGSAWLWLIPSLLRHHTGREVFAMTNWKALWTSYGCVGFGGLLLISRGSCSVRWTSWCLSDSCLWVLELGKVYRDLFLQVFTGYLNQDAFPVLAPATIVTAAFKIFFSYCNLPHKSICRKE